MSQQIRFEIPKMNCAGCAGRIETALRGVGGVGEVHVNVADRSARVAPGKAAIADLQEALGAAGYPARSETVRLDLTGLSCASCAGRVEAALRDVPGVTDAVVNFAALTATVTRIGGMAANGELIRAVERAGYGATLPEAAHPAQDREAAEARIALARVLIAGALTLPVFIMEMGGHIVPVFHHWIHGTIGQQAAWGLQFLLTTLVLAWPGRVFFAQGVPALLRGAPEMNALVALGTGAAWGFSTVALFAPALLPEGTRAVYFESAAVIITLILLGRYLEARARGRTGAAIRHLIGLEPDTARRVDKDGQIETIPLDAVRLGDMLSLRPGDRIPVDGEVTEGRSYVDESMLTGEPIPVAKDPGATLTAGTVNGDGALTFRAMAIGQDTALARIVEMVRNAQGARLPIQSLADRVVRVFVPAVMAVAVLTVALWLLLGPDPALGLALVAGVSVLIIACPCAMGLATPTSIMVGTGRGAEMGVLFRKGEALQRLSELRVAAFDKTGTLTEGRPSLSEVVMLGAQDRGRLLRLVAGAEAQSSHPIAKALVAAAEGQDVPTPSEMRNLSGHGLMAVVEGHRLLIGAARLMAQEGIALPPETGEVEARMAEHGETPVYVAVDGALAALLSVTDRLKPSAKPMVAALKAQGLEVALITGDTKATAHAIARELGITHVMAEVLPGGKQEALRDLRARFGPVAFTGDGINDAPALAEADIGLAIGTGTDVAIEAADVVLMSEDLRGVERAIALSRATLRNIRQNLFWAFAYNTALIPVAAGVLYPVSGTLLSPMLAAGAMALSSLFVLGNALRLRRFAARATGPDDTAPTLSQAPAQ